MTDHRAENARAATLVKRIAEGDRAAETPLIRMYDRRLLVKLRQHTLDTHRLNDLRQEVWIRAIEILRAGRIAQPERFFGFLLGTARNVVFEDIKARRRQVVSIDEVAPIRDAGKAIEHLLDEKLLAGRVKDCIGQLSERDRQILVRHYLREEAKEVTCKVLDLTSANYNNVLHRARKRLADALTTLAEAEDGSTDALLERS